MIGPPVHPFVGYYWATNKKYLCEAERMIDPGACSVEPHIFKELTIALFGTLIAPIGVLLFDYHYRASAAPQESFSVLVRSSGPDACILSLGALGAVVVDPHFRTLAGDFLGPCMLVMFLGLLSIRVSCMKLRRMADTADVPVTYKHGLWSLLFVFTVILTSYLVPSLK